MSKEMEIEKLRRLKDQIKNTFIKMQEDLSKSTLSHEEKLELEKQKVQIIFSKVETACNGNHTMAAEIIEYALKQMCIEEHGEVQVMIHETAFLKANQKI